MNSKYREVPRYKSPTSSRFKGVSTGAIAAREAEQARQKALDLELGITNYAYISAGVLTLAVFFDATAWATTGWGYAEEDGEYTEVGLWRICHGRLGVSESSPSGLLGDRAAGQGQTDPECVFPTNVHQDWIFKGLVMEIMAGFCALALFVCLCIFVASLKCTRVQSRTMIITFIPLSFLAALMNFIGLLTFALNMFSIRCHPSYSIALDTFGVLGFVSGGVCALLEIQGCFRAAIEEPEPGPAAALHRPPVTALTFVTS